MMRLLATIILSCFFFCTIKAEDKPLAGTITGPLTVCQGSTGIKYTVEGSSATSGYQWTVPVGVTITAGAGTNVITVSFASNALNGNTILVGGNGLNTSLTVNVIAKPVSTPIITGPASVCPGQSGVVFTISGVTDQTTNYAWISPQTGGSVASSSFNSATVNFSSTYTGTQPLGFYVVNGVCGPGPIAWKTISPTTKPETPGAITAANGAFVLPGQTGVAYEVGSVGSLSYEWSLPQGATIATGAGTNNITVNYSSSFTGGSILVRGVNGACIGDLSSPFLAQLPTTTSILGVSPVCQGSVGGPYTVTGTSATAGFTWSLPPGATIASGAGTNVITVNYGTGMTTGGVISVLGNGVMASSTVNMLVKPVSTPVINGPAAVCAGQSNIVYNITNMTDVITTATWTPPVNATIISSDAASITLNFSGTFAGGSLSYIVENGVCGQGNATAKSISLAFPPSAPNAIQGPDLVNAGVTGIRYTVTPVPNATSYQWNLPSGVTAVSGTNTNSIVVNYSPAFSNGDITVRALSDGCNNSSLSPVFSVGLISQINSNVNYVRTKTVGVAGKKQLMQVESSTLEEVSTSFDFFDELGRPSQKLSVQASPGTKDIVWPIVLDAYGRENRKYLPFVYGSDGLYKSVTFDALGNYTGVGANTYSNNVTGNIAQDVRPFSETAFDLSPLDRSIHDYGPGQSWGPLNNNKFIGHGYLINTHAVGVSATQERVISWMVSDGGMPVRRSTLANFVEIGGYYSTGQLSILILTDEKGNSVREYRNKSGQVVLKKVQAVANSVNLNSTIDWVMTYYIYDDMGNLRFVLQPELSKVVHDAADTYVVTTTDIENLAFQYSYDARQRMITKQVPGAKAVYMVYDNRDRLVLTQDGNQRVNNLWTFTKYDELNRPIATGIKDTTAGLSLAEMQLGVNNHYAKSWAKYGETYIGASNKNVHGYSNLSYPTVTTTKTVDPNRYLTVTYYDNYTFNSYFGNSYEYINDGLTETVNGYLYEQPANAFTSVVGQVTGTKVKVLDGGITGGGAGGYTWLKSVNYYDDKYRVIQNVSDNYKSGTDRISNLYDFVGKVLKTKAIHIESDVQWTDLTLATVIGNYLKRTDPSSAWTAGAASVQSLLAGQDGWVEFVASEENTARMVGLSSVNNGVNYNTIGYAIHPRVDKTVGIYENGTLKKEAGTYASGDVFRIARVGTAVKYYKNGLQIYPSAVASTSPLLVDVSLNTTGGTVVGVKTSFSTSRHTILRRYVYDHAGRLKQTFHTLDNGPEVLLASNEYNELGQLIDKGLHSVNGATPMQSIDYRYNIRGWLISMNNSQLSIDGQTNDDAGDFFGMNLAYNEELGTGNTQRTFSNTGLVGSYIFNGNASDAVAGGLNGTVYGAQLTTDSQGNSNSAYNFTASDYIDIPNSKDSHSFIQNTGKFTISAFVKINDLSARSVIVSSTATSTAKGFCFMYETYGGGYGDHQLRFMTTNGSTSFSALGAVGTINDNNWHHIAVVGDGNTVRFYVDGVPDASPASITLFSTGSATSTTLIGKTRSASGLFLGMSGAIDEVNIFNEPLDQTEIKELSNRTPFNTVLDKGQYNGNISGMKWSVDQGMGDTKEMAYNFEYDALNRLVSANNLQSSLPGTWENGKYHEGNLTYDLNGNITSLSRSSELGVIDNLVYNYGTGTTQSNKLLSVTDKTTDAIIKLKGFTDSNTTGNDYIYDVNGNMTVDLNKGLSTPIAYNYLNLPEVVTRGGNTVRYIYDAAGRKHSQVVRAGFGIKQTDYAGEFIYEDDMLRFINHEEGRIVMSSEKLLYKHDGETLEGMTALNSTLSVVTVNGEKYVNATSSGTGSGILPIGNAINVVPGEKYLIRIKGYRSTYNAGIMIRRNNSTISYGSYLPTPVSNEAWMEQIYIVPPNTNILEIGVGWSVPTGSAGLNVNAFELIKLESAAPEYQYNLKDHLGNVRLTFTTKQNIESDTATLEDENADEEAGQFLRYDNARIVNHFLFDRTNGSKPTQIDGGAQRLSGQANEVYGLAKSLSVMPGDVINMEVYAKYIDPNESNRTAALNTLIMQIAAGTAPGTTVVDGGNYAASTSTFPFPADATQNTSSSNEVGPKAFLSWLVYDRNYTLIPSKSGFRQMSSVAKEDGSDVAHEQLSGSVTITEPGYIYVFLSNEQGANPYEVYFDDFNVDHAKSPVIQSDEYYPFGLTFNSYSRENSVLNKRKFGGKEEQTDLAFNTIDWGWRQYDPAIGRWSVIDQWSEKYHITSPYTFVMDNPVNRREIDGRYFVGKDGKEVEMSTRKNGTIKVGKNATRDLKQLVRLINSSGSKTAIGQVMKAGQNESRINVKIDKKVQDNGLLGVHQAHDKDGNILKWDSKKNDFNGTPAYVEGKEGVYKEATITIFAGNIKKDFKETGGSNGEYYGFKTITEAQEVANTFQHETNHNTDKAFIQDLKNRREGKPNSRIDSHDNVHPQEQKVYQEMESYNNGN